MRPLRFLTLLLSCFFYLVLLAAFAQEDKGLPPLKPGNPVSVDKSARAKPGDFDPLLDPPPLPHTRVTLTGGIVTGVDEVENRITVRPFGGKQRLRMDFDTR